MKRQTGHPDVEALANFRAGLVSGVHGRQIAAHIARCERCGQLSDQLSAVTSALASIPAPSLPDAVERRIGAAIAAEAAARRAASLTADSMADPSAASLAPASPAAASQVPASPVPASPVPASQVAAERRHTRRWSPRRALKSAGPRLRLSPVQMLVPVAACLLLAGLGYLLSVPRAAGMPSAGPTAAPQSASSPGNSSISRGPHRDAISPTSAAGSMPGSRAAVFLVTASATRYLKSTLRAQVNSQLARQALAPVTSLAPVITGTPGNQGSATGGSSPSNTALVPSSRLVGCVMHLTGGVQPMLVQKATYQAEPVYVIAVPDRAWVVGLDCTAAKPALITSVALAPVG